jgi:hypothetical protein
MIRPIDGAAGAVILRRHSSLGESRGIPGYPGGRPRGSAGEAGPVPPRPLPLFFVPRFRPIGGQ